VERHARLLGILAGLWGALAMLIGVSMLLLAAGALAILVGPEGEALGFAAGLTAATFALIAVFTLLWGVAHLWAASLLRRRAPAGRVLMLGLAVVNLLVLPFGTALGAYALWVLLTNDGRRLFETGATHPSSPQPIE
jgi:hypothetical protein